MSRRILLIAVVAVVLVATSVAPVAAASLEEWVAVPLPSGDWLEPGAGLPGTQVPIQPAGDCEGGAGGGCPVVS